MNTYDHEALALDARRSHIEALIGDYPQISDQETALVKRWFESQASALDVAQLASNPAIAEPYRRFRADHLDKLGMKDAAKAAIFVALVLAGLAIIMWRAF